MLHHSDREKSTLDAVGADVVSLLLEDPRREGRFAERMRKVSDRLGADTTVPMLKLDEVMPVFREDRPLLAHGTRANQFLETLPQPLSRRTAGASALSLGGLPSCQAL